MMEIPEYRPGRVCPKCGHDDVSTQFVMQTGVGHPCWPKSLGEHLHRHCRRCSHEWCEACIDADAEPAREERDSNNIAPLDTELSKLKSAIAAIADPDFTYRLRKHAAAYHALLTRYAPFKVGDRIRLARTPVITEQNAPGWMGCKHFLVQGARGTVVSSDVSADRGTIFYDVTFDTESWLDSDGKGILVEPSRRHTFTFGEDMLEDDA